MKRAAARLRRIGALPVFELVWALPAWVVLGLSRAAVLAIPFKRMAPRLGVNAGAGPWVPLIDPARERRARMIGQVVRRSARYTPWKSNCFDQAITARFLLGLYAIPYTLFLGARRSDAGDGMTAHAWLAAGRVRVTGDTGFGQFTVGGWFVAPALGRAMRLSTGDRP